MSSIEIEAVSLADRAYRAVREMIVSLELRPGAVVSERELMEQLGIGRTPLREALRRLAQEKFVAVYPRRGMFVTTVEIRDLAALCEVRLAIEGQAARPPAQRGTHQDPPATEAGDPGIHTPMRPRPPPLALHARAHPGHCTVAPTPSPSPAAR